MNLETWLALYRHPGESREEAVRRYIDEQGIVDPAEKESAKNQLTPPTPADFFSDSDNIIRTFIRIILERHLM